MKVVILYRNPLGHLTQWGSKSDTCEKMFVYNPNTAVKQVRGIDPDFIMVNKAFNMDVVEELVKEYPMVYFYGDYRHNLGHQFYHFCRLAAVVLLTWYREDIYKQFNCRHIKQGVDPKLWHPIPESPELYDVVFTGNRSGPPGARGDILNRLNSDFKLLVVGSGWGKPLKSIGRKGPYNTNVHLSLGKMNVGLFNFEDLTSVKYYTSNRLYQGMASGKPHIGPYTVGLRSQFKEEDGYIDHKNYEDLKNKIKYLLKNPPLRKEIGKKQHRCIMENHTTWHMWKMVEDILSEHL